MPYANISAAITQADIDAIKTATATITSKLPFLIALTPDERKTLLKMGDKSVEYVRQCLQAAKSNPSVLPADFNVAEFDKDVTLSSNLFSVLTPLLQLTEKIDDTLMAVGSEAMTQSNVVYSQMKLSAKRSPGLKIVAEQLGERFKAIGANRAKGKGGSNSPSK